MEVNSIRQKLVDAIQRVEGVLDVELGEYAAKSGIRYGI